MTKRQIKRQIKMVLRVINILMAHADHKKKFTKSQLRSLNRAIALLVEQL